MNEDVTVKQGVNSAAEKTLHQTILDEIEGRILSGEWAPGTRIPYEVELAGHYGCSRMTVNKVLTQLAQAGLIERRRKAGTYVSQPRAHSAVLDIHDLRSEVEGLGLSYSYKLLARAVRKARPVERGWFSFGETGRLLHVIAVHGSGGKPFCHEDRLINLDAIPEAAAETFEAIAPGEWLLSRIPWSSAEHRIRAAGAAADTERLLGIASGTPCLVITRRTFSQAAVLTRVELTYPGDSHELIARFSPADQGQR